MDDLSNIYEEADRFVYKACFRYKPHHPELWEDGMQEGMIQVWRDLEAGETVKLKILRRAALAANRFFQRNGEYFFGKERKSREGLITSSSGRAAQEKVQAYLDEVLPVRGNVWPTNTEIAKATGLSRPTVVKIAKRIKEGRVDHMVYREDGRRDWDFYKTVSVEELGRTSNIFADNFNRHWSDDTRMPSVEFEDDLMAHHGFLDIVSQVNDHHKEVLYLYFVEGLSANEIAKHFGLASSAIASRHIQGAINQARFVVDPYQGECAAHHQRTPENTVVSRRKDGTLSRTCRACQGRRSAQGGAKKPVKPGAKIGRPTTTDCPHGHGPKTYQDSRGTMRCHTCKNEQSLRSLRKKKQSESS